jgi:mannosyltransferase OCH1-like enzyme
MVITFIFLLILIFIIFYNKVYYKKSSVIPKHVYQTWHSSDIPKTIKEGMISLRKKKSRFSISFL